MTPLALAPEHKTSSSVHVDLENFIEDMKLETISHNKRALKDVKKKLLDKHYKSHYI